MAKPDTPVSALERRRHDEAPPPFHWPRWARPATSCFGERTTTEAKRACEEPTAARNRRLEARPGEPAAPPAGAGRSPRPRDQAEHPGTPTTNATTTAGAELDGYSGHVAHSRGCDH